MIKIIASKNALIIFFLVSFIEKVEVECGKDRKLWYFAFCRGLVPFKKLFLGHGELYLIVMVKFVFLILVKAWKLRFMNK